MIFQGGRAIGRLPQWSLQSLGGRRAALSSSIERVATFHNVFQNQHILDLSLKISLITPVTRRTYADKPVSRPKAHTGRTTTAARKVPTTSKTKAAKKPAPNTKAPKAVPKAKSKAKPRVKPKPKPKPAKKAKAKPKRRELTEAQKQSATIKKLKIDALKTPQAFGQTTWHVFFAEAIKGTSTGAKGTHPLGSIMKKSSMDYKNLSPERLEHYNHLANQNKAANEKAYREWIESHTPEVIRRANLARRILNRKQKTRSYPLRDHRQVKRLRSSYIFFHKDRWASGDFKGMKVHEAAKLISREWKGLSASEKKPYEDNAKQELARYAQEVKTVYNRDVSSQSPATAAA